jgi:hypothetical protein
MPNTAVSLLSVDGESGEAVTVHFLGKVDHLSDNMGVSAATLRGGKL